MIGLTLVAFVAVLGRGIERSTGAAVHRLARADYVVTAADGYGPLPVAAARTLASAADVTLVSAVRQQTTRLRGAEVAVSGVDRNFARLSRVDWADGSDAVLAGLAENEAIVDRRFATDHGLQVGSPLELGTPDGRTARLQPLQALQYE